MQQPTVIVLASGRGERFTASGGIGHKLQAQLGGKTVLEHTLDSVRASGLPWHLEDAGHPGMGDSIAAAVRATSDAAGWLILPADLPLVDSMTLRLVATALRFESVVVPVYRGQRGHPVGFAAHLRAELAGLRGERGAASIVQHYPPAQLVTGDRGCITDIDTRLDLQTAQYLLDCRASQGLTGQIATPFVQ